MVEALTCCKKEKKIENNDQAHYDMQSRMLANKKNYTCKKIEKKEKEEEYSRDKNVEI